jgi:DNA-directed RNA polymerase specialized sigma24 family protein
MDHLAPLIEPHIPALRSYACALLHDRDDADDLVQCTLEHAVRGWHLRRPEGDVSVWLFTVEHNLFVSLRRRRARRGAHLALQAGSVDAVAAMATGLADWQSTDGRDRRVGLVHGVNRHADLDAECEWHQWLARWIG